MFEAGKTYGRYLLLGVLLVANYFLWNAVIATDDNRILTVAFLDVGQGDSIFIEAPNGNQMLIDGGPSGQVVLRALSEVMPFYDRSIDGVIATHPDKDHIGGLSSVLERYDVSYFFEPGVEHDTGAYAGLLESVDVENAEHIFARRGMRIVLDDEVFLDILFPDRDPKSMETNDASVIAKLIYGETSFLLTGDTTKKIERYVASLDAKALDIDVLKAAHHGSKTSSDPILLGFASPAYAVISSGEGNSYGHPHKEVTDRLQQFGAEIVETAKVGTIIFESDGTNLKYKK
ncbi:MAG: MBL fold metallo-hydrolase [Parcubacteria group bacterium]|nr:MBL fold metallo-hydrolase [Parcubacteria group bacterium]